MQNSSLSKVVVIILGILEKEFSTVLFQYRFIRKNLSARQQDFRLKIRIGTSTNAVHGDISTLLRKFLRFSRLVQILLNSHKLYFN